ncbi:response regulator with CheY-like receiver domain and winged-helix DNA-binding domain [Thermoplasmatales archaeon SCGC AB-540-F20]|nr:response regulator with CheY-like receiver domain and winged-helix DNA-binding domain [Thermoplasmatales archaeon SCGC AB-540-F20]
MKKSILIVDDNPDVRFSVKLGLEDLDASYEVITAESGDKCLEFLKNNQIPDIILLDIMMPREDGWNIFAKVKEKLEWRNIPIIFLTAKTDDYSKGFGSISADDYVEKPFDMEDLKKRIDNILNR